MRPYRGYCYGTAVLASLVFEGCGLGVPPEEQVQVIRTPAGPVLPTAPITVRWSFASLEGQIAVRQEERELSFRELSIENGVVVSPRARWPQGTVHIDFLDGLRASGGAVVPLVVSFDVLGEDISSLGLVRRPVPGTRAPFNLGWVWVEGGDAELRFVSTSSDAVRGVRLQDSIYQINGRDCPRFCPDQAYRLIDPVSKSDPTGWVLTSGLEDVDPPVLEAFLVEVAPGTLWVDVSASEPVRAEGLWKGAGQEGALLMQTLPGKQLRLAAGAPPPDGVQIEVEVHIHDRAGHTIEQKAEVAMPALVEVQITELVPSPVHDWGDSTENGVPFDRFYGDGAVTDSDEWVELVHHHHQPVQLQGLGLVLEVVDSSPSRTSVLEAPYLRFGDGGDPSFWAPGEALVMRIRGDMTSTNFQLRLWSGHRILDSVVVSEELSADHPGGRPPGWFEAIARTSYGTWAWCEPTPGDPAPGQACLH